MPVFRIPRQLWLPDPTLAHHSGVLAVGGDLSPARLLHAYRHGVFPWFGPGDPILWWSPDPRMVLHPSSLHVHRSLRKRLRRQDYRVTMDQAFPEVLRRCAEVPRPGQEGTWLVPELQDGLLALNAQGYAHSIEAWDPSGALVGGLYGIQAGATFCGESMFALAPDASKVAFVFAVHQLAAWGVHQIDCQIYTDHLARFGAKEIPRSAYLHDLQRGLAGGPAPGPWTLDVDPAVVTAPPRGPSTHEA